MPTYQFKCTNCTREVERIQSIASTSNEIFQLCTCDADMHKFTKVIKTVPPVHYKGLWNDKTC